MKNKICKNLIVILGIISVFLLIGCAKNNIDYTILVNKETKISTDWEKNLQGNLVSVENSLGKEITLEKVTMQQINALKEDLAKENIYIDLDSGYRSVDEQIDLANRFKEEYGEEYVKKYVATPGYSEHQTALAVDVYLIKDGVVIDENEAMIKESEIWGKIHEKLAQYGFILRYPENKEDITGYSYEPWYFRYVGVDVAQDIASNDLTLEEYKNK